MAWCERKLRARSRRGRRPLFLMRRGSVVHVCKSVHTLLRRDDSSCVTAGCSAKCDRGEARAVDETERMGARETCAVSERGLFLRGCPADDGSVGVSSSRRDPIADRTFGPQAPGAVSLQREYSLLVLRGRQPVRVIVQIYYIYLYARRGEPDPSWPARPGREICCTLDTTHAGAREICASSTCATRTKQPTDRAIHGTQETVT